MNYVTLKKLILALLVVTAVGGSICYAGPFARLRARRHARIAARIECRNGGVGVRYAWHTRRATVINVRQDRVETRRYGAIRTGAYAASAGSSATASAGSSATASTGSTAYGGSAGSTTTTYYYSTPREYAYASSGCVNCGEATPLR